MEYNKNDFGKFELLSQKNVDTGMGLERTLAAINGLDDNYMTELFLPIIKKIEELSGKKYTDELKKPMRIIADHLKAAVFILGDEKGISPSNTGQGYVVRRLIRRAVRYGRQLDLKLFTEKIALEIISIYKQTYPELFKNQKFIIDSLITEESKFEKTLENGLKEFEKGTDPFVLFTSYGFPFELTRELADERGIKISEEKFTKQLQKHQELSRTASSGMFKGGLSDAGEETKKLHTATHLLRQALEDVLKDTIIQKGSNINPERLRFDFTFSRKLTDDEIKKTEDLVNKKILEKIPVKKVIMKKDEALKIGAMHTFFDKYGDEVSVYYIGDSLEDAYSKEFCGGPHVDNTDELGFFTILKEESVSSGVRRIKASLSEKN